MKHFNIKRSKFILGLSALALFATVSACNKEKDAKPTISQVAVGMKDFTQLEAAAIRGGVAVTLSEKNPNDPAGAYTVFAPTNAAFARLGLVNAEDLIALQKPFLTNVLLYHVNNGNTLSSSFPGNVNIPSLLGPTKRYIVRGAGTPSNPSEFYINGSKILTTNLTADNGTVHVIDKVLLATGANIAQSTIFFAQGNGFVNPELSFLLEAVVYADLVTALSNPASRFTVFAPTNQAFKDLGKILGVAINVPADIRKLPKATVANVLLSHVFDLTDGIGTGKFSSELPNNVEIASLNGKKILTGSFVNGTVTVKGSSNTVPANMVIPDVQTTNGVVHVIDRVILN